MTTITTKQELCEMIKEAISLIPSFTVQKLTRGTTNVEEAAAKVVKQVKLYRKKASDIIATDNFIKKYQTYILDNEEFYITCKDAYNIVLQSDFANLYSNATKFVRSLNENLRRLIKSHENYRITEQVYTELKSELDTMAEDVNQIFVSNFEMEICGKDEKGLYMTRLILDNDWAKIVATKEEK